MWRHVNVGGNVAVMSLGVAHSDMSCRGRDVFPGFVVRSSNPDQKKLQSRDDWEKLWKDTQKRMSSEDYVEQPFDRWQSDHPLCA